MTPHRTTATPRHTLAKSERVCSRATVETLFGGGHSRAMSAFPLRMVYMVAPRPEGAPAVQVLVSVPKRCFKRAVKRNRVKRQVREAYRLHKHSLWAAVNRCRKGHMVVLAFICTDSTLHPTDLVESKVENLLGRLTEKLTHGPKPGAKPGDAHGTPAAPSAARQQGEGVPHGTKAAPHDTKSTLS